MSVSIVAYHQVSILPDSRILLQAAGEKRKRRSFMRPAAHCEQLADYCLCGFGPLLLRRHDVHRVSTLDGDTVVGLARQRGLRGISIPFDNILYLDDQIQVSITVNVLH